MKKHHLTGCIAGVTATLLTGCAVPAEKITADSLPEGFVMLSSVLPDAMADMRYAGAFNFVGTPIDGYEAPVPIMTREAAEALKKADALLQEKGYRIKIFDAYRPQRAVDHFVRWSRDPRSAAMKARFYPDLEKAQLLSGNYIASKSSHSRGSAVDVTLFDIKLNREADMGSCFDFFGERSHFDYAGPLTARQSANRLLLRQTMISCGFKPLDTEWWHFSLMEEPFPETYFDFPVRSYPGK